MHDASDLTIDLTLVKRLVELQGGTITVESHPAKGSTFTLRIPRMAPRTSRSAPPDEHSTSAKRILVVDDNVDSGEMLVELAQSWGHEAQHAYDGPSALELAATMHPDVVFLDIGLPGMDGYEVAARLREMPATADARIIALSGYGQEDDRKKSRAAGCDAHLVKPVEASRLAAAIAD